MLAILLILLKTLFYHSYNVMNAAISGYNFILSVIPSRRQHPSKLSINLFAS